MSPILLATRPSTVLVTPPLILLPQFVAFSDLPTNTVTNIRLLLQHFSRLVPTTFRFRFQFAFNVDDATINRSQSIIVSVSSIQICTWMYVCMYVCMYVYGMYKHYHMPNAAIDTKMLQVPQWFDEETRGNANPARASTYLLLLLLLL